MAGNDGEKRRMQAMGERLCWEGGKQTSGRRTDAVTCVLWQDERYASCCFMVFAPASSLHSTTVVNKVVEPKAAAAT